METDFRRTGLLQQNGAGYDAAIRHSLVGLHEHGRLSVAAQDGRRALDDRGVVDGLVLAVADIQEIPAFAVDAQDQRLVVAQELGVKLLRRRVWQVDADALRQ